MPYFRAFSNWRGWIAFGVVWMALNAAAYSVFIERPSWSRGPADDEPSATVARVYKTDEQLTPTVNCRNSNQQLQYRLMSPDDSSATRQPLVLFLHGAGRRGTDNTRQLVGFPSRMTETDYRQRFPCYLLAPQCPEGTYWLAKVNELERLLDCVCGAFPVDRRRVYLVGSSMGGFGSWALAAKRPDFFAAVVPVCGGGDVSQAAKLKDVPIWAVHGDADDVVPVKNTRAMIDAIRSAGGKPHYSELAGVGHDSFTPTYSDPDGILTWMFEQVNDRVVK